MNQSGEIPVSPKSDISLPYGVMIDGVVYPLENQPDKAVPKPWFTGNVDSGHANG